MEQTFKTHTLLIYNISIQKIHEFTWTEIEKYHGVNLKWKVDIQGEVNEIKTRIDEYIKLEKKRRDKKLFSSVNDQTDNKSQNSFDKLNPEYGSSIESDWSTIQWDTLNSTTNNEWTENNPKVKIPSIFRKMEYQSRTAPIYHQNISSVRIIKVKEKEGKSEPKNGPLRWIEYINRMIMAKWFLYV